MTESKSESLFERLGGENAIVAAVGIFYDKIESDPTLAPFFEGLDMDKQVKKQIGFMTTAFGGPNSYTGRDLRTAHAGAVAKGLNDEHFDRVAGHLKDTLTELKVPAELIEEALGIVATTRDDVLCR